MTDLIQPPDVLYVDWNPENIHASTHSINDVSGEGIPYLHPTVVGQREGSLVWDVTRAREAQEKAEARAAAAEAELAALRDSLPPQRSEQRP